MSVSASPVMDNPADEPSGASPPGASPPEKPAPSGAGRVAMAAGIMVAAIFLSRILGLVRDMVVSYYFGAQVGIVTDAYKAAFSLPDLFYYLIAGGALSSAFIPVFTEYLTKGDEENAWKVFSVFGTVIALALAVVVLIGEVFTEWLLGTFLVPGWTGEKLQLTASITRIIFPAQICFFLGGLMMSTLYVRNQFLMPALGPVVYNIAIIVGGVIGGSLFGSYYGIYGLAWGVLVGAFIGNVLMQIWAMRRLGVKYRPSLDIRHPGVVKVAKLMLPVLLGLSLPQLCVILTRPFASFLEQGSVTWLDNANKIMQLPLGIFAQALSVAIFPTLSAMAAKGDMPGLRKHFSLGLRSILFLTIPSAVLIIVLAVPITAVLFQRGLWTWEDTQATAAATVFYSIAIFAVSAQQIVNRGFYSMQNTVTPMIVGTVATAGYMFLNWLLVMVLGMGTNGLALSFSIMMILTLGGLLVLFRRRVGTINGGEILGSVSRVTFAALLMGLATWGCRVLLDRMLHAYGPHGMHTLPVLGELLACTVVGGAVYLAAVRVLRVPEAEFVFGTVSGRLKRVLGRR
jgi:putative peptidoglycan lipid II flippase